MIIKFQILKSLVIETVKSTTFMKGKIDESAGDAATQKVSYHETAGDDETHERMLTLDFDTALEKLKTLFVDYLVPTAQTVGDNVIYYQEGKDDIVTFTLQVSRRFNGTLTDTLARISAKYVTDYMLYQWWLKTGNMKQAEPYVSFLSIDETEIRRCFVLCRPTVPTVPYTQSLTAKVDGSDTDGGVTIAVENDEVTISYSIDDGAIDDIEARSSDPSILEVQRSQEPHAFWLKPINTGVATITLFSRHSDKLEVEVEATVAKEV